MGKTNADEDIRHFYNKDPGEGGREIASARQRNSNWLIYLTPCLLILPPHLFGSSSYLGKLAGKEEARFSSWQRNPEVLHSRHNRYSSRLTSMYSSSVARAASKRNRGQEREATNVVKITGRDKRQRWQIAAITSVSETACTSETEEAAGVKRGTRLTQRKGPRYLTLFAEINL